MKYNGPRIFRRHVEHDEPANPGPLKQSPNLGGLAIPKRCYLTHLLGIAKSHDLQRDGQGNLHLGHQVPENCAHLFEAHRDFASPLFSRVSGYREVGRADFHPLRFSSEDRGPEKEKRSDQEGKHTAESGTQETRASTHWPELRFVADILHHGRFGAHSTPTVPEASMRRITLRLRTEVRSEEHTSELQSL